jgi:ABC-type dipeptide/oligopeptide/nickel transport system ATPase component
MDIIENEKEIIELSQETQSDSESKVLLNVKGLKTYFFTEEGIVKAVDGVSFNIYKDEIIGLVGETGCGKSVTALSILRIVRSPGKIMEGEITFKDISLLDLTEKEMREKRGKNITMIFQDPLNSLNPVLKVGDQISEVFELHQLEKVKTILDQKKLERKIKLTEKKKISSRIKG